MKFKELILIPNLLSILRIILSIPTAYIIYVDYETKKTLIILLLILLFITDILDGYVARKHDMISETGKIIDPLADKFAVVLLSVMIFLKNFISTWFFIVIIFRDLLILVFGLILRKKMNLTLMSNFPGKAAVFSIGVILLLSIINPEFLNDKLSFLYYVSVIIIIYSLITYFKRFKNIIGVK